MSKATTLPVVTLRPPSGLVNDRRKDGWELLEDAPVIGEPTLELAEFLRDGEEYVRGDVMFARAVELGNRAGQQHAERLLAQQGDIPEEWRQYYLPFTGTKWRDSDGDLFVPYLGWDSDGRRWLLDWGRLGFDWGRSVRLVRCK